MIAALIRWSVANRVLVLVATFFVTAWGIHALRQTPVDALPTIVEATIDSIALVVEPTVDAIALGQAL